MNYNIKHNQIENQDDSHARAELPDVAASCPINSKPKSQMAFEHIKCVSPMTFSRKLHQSHAREIAEKLEQAINANSLEEIKELLDKVIEIDSGG